MCTSRDSSVGIATGYGLEDQIDPGRVKNVHFSILSRPALRSTQPRIKWVPGVKVQGREADHLPPTSAEVKKNVDLYIQSPIHLHGVMLN
jgi:hypothetical protein